MLLLPASVNALEAGDTARLLTQALKRETEAGAVVVDASNLQHFDSAALAVLLECRRVAEAWGKPFLLRNTPAKLASLAKLYGVDQLLLGTATESGAAASATAP